MEIASTVDPERPIHDGAGPSTDRRPTAGRVASTFRRSGRRGRWFAKLGLALTIASVVGFVALDGGPIGAKGRGLALEGKDRLVEALVPSAHARKQEAATGSESRAGSTGSAKPAVPWNGLVKATALERKAIGFKIFTVANQTEPIHLELPGKTDYDHNTLSKIRPRFDNALVERVFVSVGQSVKKGDPLYELKSGDLAKMKTDCRTKYVQWDHDHKILLQREPLIKEGRITQMVWTDTLNDEKKSRLDYLNARDLLGTYDLTGEQIDKLIEGVGDDKKKALDAAADTQDISRMTVMSKYDGVVVERDVVPGNFYDPTNILLVISPMDQLWVWGDVFESDQDKVHVGQKWDIEFQFTHERFEGKVESIANGIDPETRTVRIRASIPNPQKNLKARMLVRAILQVEPMPNDTRIPRNALVVDDGQYFTFVQKGHEGDDADLFERRKLEIEQEDHDVVVVKRGLRPGDRVVSNGSLILEQMYEDQSTVDTGMPRA